MKTALRLPAVFLLTAMLAGCATQKQAGKNDKATASQALYGQALQALQEQHFTIEVSEFQFPDGKPPVASTASYISMQGSSIVIRFSPDLSPHRPFDHLNIEDNTAKMTKEKSSKNGDARFDIKVTGAKKWQDTRLQLTLYKNTNECFVRVKGGNSEVETIRLKGHVLPTAETLYQQAVKALNEQKFRINANEFFFPGDKSPVKPSVGNYLSMQGKQAVLKFSPDLFPGTPLSYLTITDEDAEIVEEKRKKNGDVQYSLKMIGLANNQDRKILITLYKNSNKCYVQVFNELLAYHIVDFTGQVFPIGK